MPSLFTLALSLLAAYISTYVYTFTTNYLKARRSGMPSILVPWNQQHIIWMLISPPLRSWFEAHLPTRIFNRLTLCIYGWEFFQRMQPFEEFVGGAKTFLLVTCGRLEMYSGDAEVVAQVLGRPREFVQLDIGNWVMGVFGSNVLTTDGDHWARQRKVVATVINERISKAVFNESVTQTQGLLEELSAQQGSDGVAETNQLFTWAKKVAINVLSAAGMGAPVPWEDDTDDRPKPGFQQTYIQSVKKVIESVAGPIILPLWFLRNYPSFLPAHQFMHELDIAKTEFPTHTKDLLEKERLRSETEGSATKSNILSQLLQASDQPLDGDAKASKGASTKALSDEELVGNLFIFTAAGFDTTANTLSYAFVLLARHPHWQSWILCEIDALVPASQPLDYTAVYPKVVRILAFMYETLRLFTPLVHISKQAQQAQTITTSNQHYFLPANTTVYIDTIALHGDPGLWRGLNAQPDEVIEAEDEWTFRPSRWIDAQGKLFQPPRGSYVPWSMGPRVCPGMKMAMVEFVAVVVTLLRGHRIEAVALDGETRAETEQRLDKAMRNSMSILTISMKDIYDVPAGSDKGLKLGLRRRQ